MDGLVGGPLLVAGLVTPGPPVHPALVRLSARTSVCPVDRHPPLAAAWAHRRVTVAKKWTKPQKIARKVLITISGSVSFLQCFDAVGWAGGRKGIRPVKTEWWGAGMVICLERGADLHMAQVMPLPLTVSCFSKIQIGLTFLIPAHPGSPGQYDTIRDAILTCARKPTQVGLIYRTETTTKNRKREKLKSKNSLC